MDSRCTKNGSTGKEKYVFLLTFADIDFLYSCFSFSDVKLYHIIVLPRVMFERFSEKDYSHVLMYESARDEIADLLVRACKDSKHKFDGIVLEVWFQLAGRVQDRHLLRLVEHLGKGVLFYFI